jgi:hypothetical protein
MNALLASYTTSIEGKCSKTVVHSKMQVSQRNSEVAAPVSEGLSGSPITAAPATTNQLVSHGSTISAYYFTADIGRLTWQFLISNNLPSVQPTCSIYILRSHAVDCSGVGNHPEGELASKETVSYACCVAEIFLFLSSRQEERISDGQEVE